MLDNNTVYFLNIIWTYCTCMYYVSEINEYYYYVQTVHKNNNKVLGWRRNQMKINLENKQDLGASTLRQITYIP